jgi:hypothetical protein
MASFNLSISISGALDCMVEHKGGKGDRVAAMAVHRIPGSLFAMIMEEEGS